jgi:hypothetical protein
LRQQKLASQHHGSKQKRARSGALFMGRLYDDAGHRMTPAHANKGGVCYRYYVSSALSEGRPAGSVARVSAPEIESLVLQALRERYPEHAGLDDRALVTGSVDTITIRDAAVEISLAGPIGIVDNELKSRAAPVHLLRF